MYTYTNTISGCQVMRPLLKEKPQDHAFQTISVNGPIGFLMSNLSLTDAFVNGGLPCLDVLCGDVKWL